MFTHFNTLTLDSLNRLKDFYKYIFFISFFLLLNPLLYWWQNIKIAINQLTITFVQSALRENWMLFLNNCSNFAEDKLAVGDYKR